MPPAQTPLRLQVLQRGQLEMAVYAVLPAHEREARVRVLLPAVAEAWEVVAWRLETMR